MKRLVSFRVRSVSLYISFKAANGAFLPQHIKDVVGKNNIKI